MNLDDLAAIALNELGCDVPRSSQMEADQIRPWTEPTRLAPRGSHVVVDAYCSVHDMLHAAISEHGGRASLKDIYSCCARKGRIAYKRTGGSRLITLNSHWKSQVRHALYTSNRFCRCHDNPDLWSVSRSHAHIRPETTRVSVVAGFETGGGRGGTSGRKRSGQSSPTENDGESEEEAQERGREATPRALSRPMRSTLFARNRPPFGHEQGDAAAHHANRGASVSTMTTRRARSLAAAVLPPPPPPPAAQRALRSLYPLYPETPQPTVRKPRTQPSRTARSQCAILVSALPTAMDDHPSLPSSPAVTPSGRRQTRATMRAALAPPLVHLPSALPLAPPLVAPPLPLQQQKPVVMLTHPTARRATPATPLVSIHHARPPPSSTPLHPPTCTPAMTWTPSAALTATPHAHRTSTMLTATASLLPSSTMGRSALLLRTPTSLVAPLTTVIDTALTSMAAEMEGVEENTSGAAARGVHAATLGPALLGKRRVEEVADRVEGMAMPTRKRFRAFEALVPSMSIGGASGGGMVPLANPFSFPAPRAVREDPMLFASPPWIQGGVATMAEVADEITAPPRYKTRRASAAGLNGMENGNGVGGGVPAGLEGLETTSCININSRWG